MNNTLGYISLFNQFDDELSPVINSMDFIYELDITKLSRNIYRFTLTVL